MFTAFKALPVAGALFLINDDDPRLRENLAR
jgi:hypothetical protein